MSGRVSLHWLTFDSGRPSAIHSHRYVAAQRNAIELAVEIERKDISWGEMGGRAIVPEGDAARSPPEPDRVLRTDDMFEQQFQKQLAFAWMQAGDALQKGRADEQNTFAAFRDDADERMLADQRALRGLFDEMCCRLLSF